MRLILFLFLLPAASYCQSTSTVVDVLTYHNNNARSGSTLRETLLTPTNVAGSFGKLFTLPVDGAVYAQPLYMSGVIVNGENHNVVFVATENNSVYAFDADTAGAPLWQANFNYGRAGTTVTPVSSADVSCTDLQPVIGITGTPVIDSTTNILYTAAKSKEVSPSGTSFYLRIHGVNILTGKEAFPQINVSASVPGTCGSVLKGNVLFDPLIQSQRSGLLLLNHILYVASASHCDLGLYNGWLLGYDTRTGKQVAVFNTTPDDSTGRCQGGIWQSGGAPAADLANNIYVLTGNGGFNANHGGRSYGDSAVKLSTGSTGAVTVADYFTPFNVDNLTDQDLDFAGSGATMLLPEQPGANPRLLVAAGKYGTIYLINRDKMGQFSPTQDNVVQSLSQAIGDGGSSYPPPVYFKEKIYYAASNDTIKGFQLSNGLFDTTPFATSVTKFGYLGAGLSLSSAPDGSNAILWALEGTSQPSVLHAYRATDLKELYNTNVELGGADSPGDAVKFAIPTVANGKVYVGTQNGLVVYGIKPPPKKKVFIPQ